MSANSCLGMAPGFLLLTTLEVSTKPAISFCTWMAVAVAEIVPRLVPTTHTGKSALVLIKASTFCTSAMCASLVRSTYSSSAESLGRPKMATLKPLARKYGLERTKKLLPVAFPSSTLPKPPPPPGKSKTVAFALGIDSQNSVVDTPSRVGTLISSPAEAKHEAASRKIASSFFSILDNRIYTENGWARLLSILWNGTTGFSH